MFCSSQNLKIKSVKIGGYPWLFWFSLLEAPAFGICPHPLLRNLATPPLEMVHFTHRNAASHSENQPPKLETQQ
jgi:hypothetical protein